MIRTNKYDTRATFELNNNNKISGENVKIRNRKINKNKL